MLNSSSIKWIAVICECDILRKLKFRKHANDLKVEQCFAAFWAIPPQRGKSLFTNLKTIYHHTLAFRFFRSNNRFENQIRNFRRGRSSGNEEKSLIRTTIRPSPFEKIPFNEGSVESRQLWKAAIFTAAFGTGSFIGAAIWEYEGVRARAVRAARAPFSWAMQTKKRAVINYFRVRLNSI